MLFGLGQALPFLADAVSYAASFGTVSRIRGQFRPRRVTVLGWVMPGLRRSQPPAGGACPQAAPRAE